METKGAAAASCVMGDITLSSSGRLRILALTVVTAKCQKEQMSKLSPINLWVSCHKERHSRGTEFCSFLLFAFDTPERKAHSFLPEPPPRRPPHIPRFGSPQPTSRSQQSACECLRECLCVCDRERERVKVLSKTGNDPQQSRQWCHRTGR